MGAPTWSLLHLSLAANVIKAPAIIQHAEPLELNYCDCATRTSTSPPPPSQHDCHSEANLGWIWSLGKTTRLAGPEAPSPVIPHLGTKQAQRKGNLPSRSTHAHTHPRQTRGYGTTLKAPPFTTHQTRKTASWEIWVFTRVFA